MALGWADPRLATMLEHTGASVQHLPEAFISHRHRLRLRKLEVAHAKRLRSPTSAIAARRRRRMAPLAQRTIMKCRELIFDVQATFGTSVESLEQAVAESQESETNRASFATWLDRVDADVVLSLTPYHDQDSLLLAAATSRKVGTAISFISFDNLTTRRRVSPSCDRYIVWNEHNRQELVHAFGPQVINRTAVLGAVQYTLHRRSEFIIPDPDWRRILGLPQTGSVLLYGAGPSELTPGEPHLVAAFADSLRLTLGSEAPTVLVRIHPNDDPTRWTGVLRPGVQVDTAWAVPGEGARAWPTSHDIRMQMSTLVHCSVHVSICSSMALDAAAVDRPTVAPSFIPQAGRGVAALD